MANHQTLAGIETALPDPAARDEYDSIVSANGALP
jgi:hypothetical protein